MTHISSKSLPRCVSTILDVTHSLILITYHYSRNIIMEPVSYRSLKDLKKNRDKSRGAVVPPPPAEPQMGYGARNTGNTIGRDLGPSGSRPTEKKGWSGSVQNRMPESVIPEPSQHIPMSHVEPIHAPHLPSQPSRQPPSQHGYQPPSASSRWGGSSNPDSKATMTNVHPKQPSGSRSGWSGGRAGTSSSAADPKRLSQLREGRHYIPPGERETALEMHTAGGEKQSWSQWASQGATSAWATTSTGAAQAWQVTSEKASKTWDGVNDAHKKDQVRDCEGRAYSRRYLPSVEEWQRRLEGRSSILPRVYGQ